jgi:hypothetical protein
MVLHNVSEVCDKCLFCNKINMQVYRTIRGLLHVSVKVAVQEVSFVCQAASYKTGCNLLKGTVYSNLLHTQSFVHSQTQKLKSISCYLRWTCSFEEMMHSKPILRMVLIMPYPHLVPTGSGLSLLSLFWPS